MAKRKTEEEKVANVISRIVSDLRLDLDQVGVYLARNNPNVSYTRLQIIAEAAEFEKEMSNVRSNTYPLF
jgi:hypothetical protein